MGGFRGGAGERRWALGAGAMEGEGRFRGARSSEAGLAVQGLGKDLGRGGGGALLRPGQGLFAPSDPT